MRSCGLLPGTRFELFRLLHGPAPTHLLRARACSTERQSASANAMPARRRLAVNPKTEAGLGKSCISVAALVDTNVLVYRFDGRFPKKQECATDLLRRGIADDSLRLPHQAILE